MPHFTNPQLWFNDEVYRTKETDKIGEAEIKYYIVQWEVVILTQVFPVPKTVDDIRMFYNGTTSGLND